MNHRVVITGIGVLAANGNGVDAYWDTLLKGESGIGTISLFDAEGLPCQIAGEVKGFDATEHIDAGLRPKRMGRFTQLAVATAEQAIADAGLTSEDLRRQGEVPVILGVSSTSLDLLEKKPDVSTAVSASPNAAASAVGYLHDVSTKLMTVANACGSGLDAIAMGAAMIRNGQADLVITGASDSTMTRYFFESMLKVRRCSTSTDGPEVSSRPFDRNRDRGVLAEGAGIVILENLAHAQARGIEPYATVRSYASAADPYGGGEGEGMATAMRSAVANAALDPGHIDYISAHGPSDVEMDIIETRMIKEVFGPRAYEVPISSIKGVTGCSLGAGSATQVISTALSLKHRVLPPTANLAAPDPECDLDYIPGGPRMAEGRFAMVNTHGFGQGNSCMILEHYT